MNENGNTVPSAPQKKRGCVGKVIKWYLLITLVSAILVFGIESIQSKKLSDAMNGLDPYGSNPAAGEKVIAYNIEKERFTTTYIPSELQAKTQEEVGYILVYQISNVDAQTTKGGRATAEKVSVQLIDHKTGEVIASDAIVPGYGAQSTTSHFSVPTKKVEGWLRSNLPNS